MSSMLSKFGFYYINKNKQKALSEESINQLEEKIESRLPENYRKFLLEFGVIGFEKTLKVKILKKEFIEEFVSIELFFGFTEDEEYNITTLTFDTYSGRIPDETIPIGQDPNGNLFLLSFIGKNKGKVWFWDHEHLELSEEKIDIIIKDLHKANIDTKQLDIDSMIWHWERLPTTILKKPLGFSSVYLVAKSFTTFLKSIIVDE